MFAAVLRPDNGLQTAGPLVPAIKESSMRSIVSVLVLFVFLSSCELIGQLTPQTYPPEWGSADGVGTAAGFTRPIGLAVDAAGNLYVADTVNHKIRRITTSAVVTTWAGGGQDGDAVGTRTQARFWYPQGVASTPEGVVYVADTLNNKIKKIDLNGVVTTIAGSNDVGQEDGQGSSARFCSPTDLALDASGSLYVVDDANTSIRKIDASGNVTTVALGLNSLQGIAVDSNGDLYGADSLNNRILKITPSGVVTTFVGGTAGLQMPLGVAFGPDGTLYVSEAAGSRIRKITPAGVVTTLAGTSGSFRFPEDLTVDSLGNVFVSDNHRIWKVTPAGQATVFAGGNGKT